MRPLLIALMLVALPPAPAPADSIDRVVVLRTAADAVATIVASCTPCDWGVAGREAALLEIAVDGRYSQHVVLAQGSRAATYRVGLGRLSPGEHRLTIARDRRRSASGAGPVTFGDVDVALVDERSPDYAWLSRAPILRARPGTAERFSDLPLLMYVEQHVTGETGRRYQLQYTVIFSHEDAGTPADRLMATWGRTTDIEFVFGVTEPAAGEPAREEIQAAEHRWVPFTGTREAAHPVLWVATENNMVADRGPDDAIRFAPAPILVTLDRASREAVMDAQPWTYAVTSAELAREGRIDAAAAPGSGRIRDPRRYAVVEACGRLEDASLAFDVGVTGTGGGVTWHPTDTDARFRIARSGCFRAAAPLSDGVTSRNITAVRGRALTRASRAGEPPLPAGGGIAGLDAVTRVFMLDDRFRPAVSPLSWSGSVRLPTDGTPVVLVEKK